MTCLTGSIERADPTTGGKSVRAQPVKQFPRNTRAEFDRTDAGSRMGEANLVILDVGGN
jgi:hypothetical protein